MSTPPNAGPRRKLVWMMMVLSVTAFIMYDGGTRRGISADRAGQLNTSTSAPTNPRVKICQTWIVPVMVKKPSNRLGISWIATVTTKSFLRSKASATAPANSPKITKGNAWKKPVRPNCNAEPEIS